MLNTLKKLLLAMLGSLRDLLPIVLVILFFQFAVLRQIPPDLGQIVLGVLFVVIGLTFFIHGLEQGLFPHASSMGGARSGSLRSGTLRSSWKRACVRGVSMPKCWGARNTSSASGAR